MDCRDDLLRIYDLLNGHFGDLHWWPAEEPFEVMVGAILTQNTAWTNVEKAIAALKGKRLLSPAALFRIAEETLAAIIRPSGYYNVKAKRLKSFVRFLQEEYAGNIGIMSSRGVAYPPGKTPRRAGHRTGNRRQHPSVCLRETGLRLRRIHPTDPPSPWHDRG